MGNYAATVLDSARYRCEDLSRSDGHGVQTDALGDCDPFGIYFCITAIGNHLVVDTDALPRSMQCDWQFSPTDPNHLALVHT